MQRELLLGLYILFFAAVHSLTAANTLKRRAYRYVSPSGYRLLYTLLAAITALPILYLWLSWRSGSSTVYNLPSPLLPVSAAMAIAGAALALNSLILTDPLEFLGIRHLLGERGQSRGLVKTGAYSMSRHPLYLGGMLILWANPWMRLIDLVLAALFTAYFIVGAWLEERKLEEEFGEEYREYRREVSMFLPVKWLQRQLSR